MADERFIGNPLRDPQDRRLPRIAGPCVLVMFGVTGDLARKKLMPAVYDLANRGLLPPGFGLVGFARREWANEDFATRVHQAVREHARTPFREEVWKQLCEGIRFVQGNLDEESSYTELARTIEDLDQLRGTNGNHAFYLSIPPGLFETVVQNLSRSGLAAPDRGGWSRVVIEKPFGHNLSSAQELNQVLSTAFPSKSVFRIDHYLGKETVQNLLALRFANEMFEPVFNNHYVDHVQITMAEYIGVGGRASYYDGIGAARDVARTTSSAARPHGDGRADLLRRDQPAPREAEGPSASRRRSGSTALYAAGTVPAGPAVAGSSVRRVRRASSPPPPPDGRRHPRDIESRRWAGVPFYLRPASDSAASPRSRWRSRRLHLPFTATDTLELGRNVGDADPARRGRTPRFGAKVPGTRWSPRRQHGLATATTESSPRRTSGCCSTSCWETPLFPQQEEVEPGADPRPGADYWATR